MDAAIEIWGDRDGKGVRVTILREYPEPGEICPRCHGGLKTVIGKTEDGEQFFRFECLMCSWASEASPGPKTRHDSWSPEV